MEIKIRERSKFNLFVFLIMLLNVTCLDNFGKETRDKTIIDDTYLENIRLLLRDICKSIDAHNWEKDKSLKECYNSSIYINEYLWLISSFIISREEHKGDHDFSSIMVLPINLNIDVCTKINREQCILRANLKKVDDNMIIEYSNISEMTTTVTDECKVTSPYIRSSLNALWLESDSKLSEVEQYQSLLVGRGFTDLIGFNDLFNDLSRLICSDIKKYIYSREYIMRNKIIISDIINKDYDFDSEGGIHDPIYVQIPVKYDFETQVNENICDKIKDNIASLDKRNKVQFNIDEKNKYLALVGIYYVPTGCESDKREKIITWRIRETNRQ